LWVLCMDNETYRILTDMKLSGVIPIRLQDFELGDTGLLEAKKNRSTIEYYFTCTPTLVLRILELNKEIDVLTYLDADLYFFGSIEPAYRELKHGSVLIIEHRFPKALEYLEKYGIYNVGLLAIRNDKPGHTCLRWWRQNCLEWCYDRVEDGKFADQKYLDDWPVRFTGIIVLRNRSIGVAPWNLAEYNGLPVIMFHFHGVKNIFSNLWDTDLIGYHALLTPNIKEQIYIPYIRELVRIRDELAVQYGWTAPQSIRVSIRNPLSYLLKCRNDYILIFS